MTSLTLRPATPADLDFLYHLHQTTLKEYVIQTWGRWDEAWQQANFRRTFDPTTRQIVVYEGQDAGVISVVRREADLFLANIGLLPAFQGRGLGARLIRRVLAEAAAEGLPLTLQVLKVNPARRLYARLGFAVIEETDTHFVMRAEKS